jgi:hypothetical protein
MITNWEILRKFEDDFISKEEVMNHDQSLKLFTSLWEEGILLDALPPKDEMEGIEVDIRIAQVLNSCLTESSPE